MTFESLDPKQIQAQIEEQFELFSKNTSLKVNTLGGVVLFILIFIYQVIHQKIPVLKINTGTLKPGESSATAQTLRVSGQEEF